MIGRTSRMYVIIDALSGVRVTDLIPAQSDALAVFGFRQFVDSEVEQHKRDRRSFQLLFVCELDETGHISAPDVPQYMCDGSTADELFERMQQEIFDKEF